MPPARSVLNAAAADEGVVMRWCAEGELAGLWRAAGLRDVRFGPLVVSTTYTDFQDLWSPLPTGVALSGAFCKSLMRSAVPRSTTPSAVASESAMLRSS